MSSHISPGFPVDLFSALAFDKTSLLYILEFKSSLPKLLNWVSWFQKQIFRSLWYLKKFCFDHLLWQMGSCRSHLLPLLSSQTPYKSCETYGWLPQSPFFITILVYFYRRRHSSTSSRLRIMALKCHRLFGSLKLDPKIIRGIFQKILRKGNFHSKQICIIHSVWYCPETQVALKLAWGKNLIPNCKWKII